MTPTMPFMLFAKLVILLKTTRVRWTEWERLSISSWAEIIAATPSWAQMESSN